jgi:phenylalanyl-tRNA synthetase beta chain
MKISYDILKQFVTPPDYVGAKELAQTLTMHTVEVEEVVDWAERLKGAVVGLVTTVKDHPKADKLKLATVDIGKKSLDVVCGGVNLRQGMKVAFAQVGTRVRWHGEAEWAPLQTATIRGVVSEGMACAAEELAIQDENAVEHGIMDLSHLQAKPGTPLAEALGLNDIILDIDNKSITHRPDLWGHLGLARELSAIWRLPLKTIKPASIQSQPEVTLKVTIAEPELCRRYLGVVISGISVGPSPAWLKTKLRMLGLRPINNIVDATNYVMLELGQPLHAFDFEKLASPEIIVRKAKPREKILTLDGEVRQLANDMLVIADSNQAQAIAGVMGGESSEVSEGTKSIVLESATFDPISIRQTASKLGLRSEASARFEKGLDPSMAELALRRVVEIILDLCPSARVASQVADAYVRPCAQTSVTLSLAWLYKRLGTVVAESEVVGILERLGFKVNARGDELEVGVPSWRATRDITLPEDLSEEIARIYGYDKIPLAMPKFAIMPPPRDEAQVMRWGIRDVLVGAGFVETLSYSFVGQEANGGLRLINPVDMTKQYLRPTLLSSFAEQFEAARKAGGATLRMFELGRVFENTAGIFSMAGKDKTKLPNQPWHLLLAVYEKSGHNFRILKGVIELIEKELGVKFEPQYNVLFGGVVAEMNLDNLQPVMTREFKPLPKYPAITRDVSMIVPTGTVWAEVAAAINKVSPLLESLEVFDVYETKGSIAFKLNFRDPTRTLKSDEVDEIMRDIIRLLQDKFKAIIR